MDTSKGHIKSHTSEHFNYMKAFNTSNILKICFNMLKTSQVVSKRLTLIEIVERIHQFVTPRNIEKYTISITDELTIHVDIFDTLHPL